MIILIAFSADIHSQIRHGGYAAAIMDITPVVKHPALIAGGRAVWMFNGRFGIGGAYHDIITDVNSAFFDSLAMDYALVQINYGGMTLEYNIPAGEYFDLGIEFLIAGGGLKLLPKNKNKPYSDFYGNDFLLWQPAINATYRISPLAKLTLALGYRKVTQFRPYLFHTANDFSDYSVSIYIRFGEY